jgi:hypothetical protein
VLTAVKRWGFAMLTYGSAWLQSRPLAAFDLGCARRPCHRQATGRRTGIFPLRSKNNRPHCLTTHNSGRMDITSMYVAPKQSEL